ncbi:MAG: ATP-binding cassette domain-containing protein [Chloroflexi bacterium]|nr:ATP-binding cassette domain-containing protein [Chloroflexota bacterium]
MTNAIEVTNLTKYYGKFMAVDHIDFAVKEGEIFGFLGPNGAGKSTTQRMLTTLLTPTEGQILILGHDLAQDAYPAKRQIGLVPEESNVYTELTAWDNLMFTGRLYRMSKADRAARAQELLETFGLWEKRDVKAENFSKGMRRRLSIAMAIIHKPALLFLDEPTPGLDAQSARTIRGLIRQLSADGTTVFMTTHQIEEANQLCDRVAIINNGKIAAIDTPEQLKQTFQRVQSVEVAFSNAQEGIKEKLANLAEVNTLVKIGDKWRLYTEDPSTLLPQIMSLADTDGLRVVSLNTLAPSLEDVFLQITGQQIGVVQHKETPKRPGMRRGKGD